MAEAEKNKVTLNTAVEAWSNTVPFRISGHVFRKIELVVVQLSDGQHIGRGEAAGVFFRQETARSMIAEIETVRSYVELGVTRNELRGMLPPGGARNALDCAMWDLESKQMSKTVSALAGVDTHKPLVTTFTVGVDTPSVMASRAREFVQAKAIKVKLNGDSLDVDRVKAVRAARGEVWLGVDANQGYSLEALQDLMPTLVDANVKLIEQPFRIGQEAVLDGIKLPIPLAADESVRSLDDIPAMVGRFEIINIKLDKCGGLTEGLLMAEKGRLLGFQIMVGGMPGTSLAVAPAIVLGQLCDYADLDAPLFFTKDRSPPVQYEDGCIRASEGLWGWQDK